MHSNKRFDRYEALYAVAEDIIAERRDGMVFLEVGTYDGARAIDLGKFWKEQTGTPFIYIGFDLFEDMDPVTNAAELSKSRLPPSREYVSTKMLAADIRCQLVQGNTRETIPNFVTNYHPNSPKPDFIYIDGGHSLATIQSDWESLLPLIQPSTYVLFDDYYENRDDFGCKQLITKLQSDSKFKVKLLDPVDTIPQNGLRIRMVLVRLQG